MINPGVNIIIRRDNRESMHPTHYWNAARKKWEISRDLATEYMDTGSFDLVCGVNQSVTKEVLDNTPEHLMMGVIIFFAPDE